MAIVLTYFDHVLEKFQCRGISFLAKGDYHVVCHLIVIRWVCCLDVGVKVGLLEYVCYRVFFC